MLSTACMTCQICKPNLPNQTYQTKPSKPNLPNQTNQTKLTKSNLPNRATKLNLPNQTSQTKPTKSNQSYWLKESTPGSVVPLAMFWQWKLNSFWSKMLVSLQDWRIRAKIIIGLNFSPGALRFKVSLGPQKIILHYFGHNTFTYFWTRKPNFRPVCWMKLGSSLQKVLFYLIKKRWPKMVMKLSGWSQSRVLNFFGQIIRVSSRLSE